MKWNCHSFHPSLTNYMIALCMLLWALSFSNVSSLVSTAKCNLKDGLITNWIILSSLNGKEMATRLLVLGSETWTFTHVVLLSLGYMTKQVNELFF